MPRIPGTSRATCPRTFGAWATGCFADGERTGPTGLAAPRKGEGSWLELFDVGDVPGLFKGP